MVPALRPGQLIIASNLFTKLSVGQIVVIKHERLDKIKRVKDIRKGQLYLLGDNARRSIDSRSFGWLPLEYIVGRIIWPRVWYKMLGTLLAAFFGFQHADLVMVQAIVMGDFMPDCPADPVR